ncbi:MobA/MobL family protein, partial [mine drainage metagenome]
NSASLRAVCRRQRRKEGGRPYGDLPYERENGIPVLRPFGYRCSRISVRRENRGPALGLVHDYSRKNGVEYCEIVLPKSAPKEFLDRSLLWNGAEASEGRKNSVVAREFEVALPSELSPSERIELVRDLAQSIVDKHLVGVDFAIHSPGKDGDQRNHHAHVLCTTRRLWSGGFGEKTREL